MVGMMKEKKTVENTEKNIYQTKKKQAHGLGERGDYTN
jgi:hypothetical protein